MIKYKIKVHETGDIFWYSQDRLHREDGPAIEYINGHKEWYKNGFRHREDGPAVIFIDGQEKWYKNGLEIEKVKK